MCPARRGELTSLSVASREPRLAEQQRENTRGHPLVGTAETAPTPSEAPGKLRGCHPRPSGTSGNVRMPSYLPSLVAF